MDTASGFNGEGERERARTVTSGSSSLKLVGLAFKESRVFGVLLLLFGNRFLVSFASGLDQGAFFLIVSDLAEEVFLDGL